MQDPEFTQMTTEYKVNAGMWATETALLWEQVDQSLVDAAQPGNKQVITEELDTIPWLSNAATEARKKHAEAFKGVVEKRKAAAVAQLSGVDARRAKLKRSEGPGEAKATCKGGGRRVSAFGVWWQEADSRATGATGQACQGLQMPSDIAPRQS